MGSQFWDAECYAEFRQFVWVEQADTQYQGKTNYLALVLRKESVCSDEVLR